MAEDEIPSPLESDDGVKLTRYQQVANTLLAEIEGGEYVIGSLLPTEHELCARFGVSRYTVREALRRLFEAGLVARRRGAGTTVVAIKRPPLYDLTVSSVMDIFNFAKNTRFEIKSVTKSTLSAEQFEDINLPPGNNWTTVLGLRYSDVDPRPVCVSHVYVNDALEKVSSRLDQPFHIVRDFAEVAFEIVVENMEQTVRASLIADEDARLLKTETGATALRIIRRYLAEDGTVIQVSDNIHPADRFSLSMTFEREGY
jgi:DNA-binding GntR family transcriptional regulator